MSEFDPVRRTPTLLMSDRSPISILLLPRNHVKLKIELNWRCESSFFLQIRRIKKKLVNLVFWYIINKWYMVFSLIRAEENGLKMGGGQGPQEVYYIGKRQFLLHKLWFLTIFRDGKPNWTTCYMSFILKWNFVIVLIEWSANWCNIRDLLNMWPLSDSKINSYFLFHQLQPSPTVWLS